MKTIKEFELIVLFIVGISHLIVGLNPFEEIYQRHQKDFYDRCQNASLGITCEGIPLAAKCVKNRNCDYAAAFWRTSTHFETDIITPKKGIPFVVVIGYAPFQSKRGNLTASCKTDLTVDDFRVIFYKFAANEVDSKLETSSVWTTGNAGFGASPEQWRHNCQNSFAVANGFYGDSSNVHSLTLDDEYIDLEFVGYPNGKNPLEGELPSFSDSEQYHSKDDVVYTNF